MKGQKSLLFMALLAIVFGSSLMMNPCFGQPIPFSSWRVMILNSQTRSELSVHCKSGDDDLGLHVIKVEGIYKWQFRENLWGTTLFWCTFDSQNGHLAFNVFWSEGEQNNWLLKRCALGTCFWIAKDDGIYLKNGLQNAYDLLHKWK